MNEEADQPKGPDSQEQELPKIGTEQLQEHKRWVESKGKEGTRVQLSGANLQGANLRRTNLKGAHLYRAKLIDATLLDANLCEANLQNATFKGATGLQARQLAGANVSGAELPKDIHEFEALDNVAEASKNARKIFISVLLGCVYSWLTIATTTDARLLNNSSSSPLPIIQAPVPIAGFYWAAPFLLLCMFVYLHLHLQRIWDRLSKLPAVFPDGRPLDERVYPWMLNGLVRAHFKLLREERRPLFSRFQTLIVIVLAWWLVPITLGLFWFRYLPRRDGWMWFQAALLVAALGFMTWFQLSARRTLRNQLREPVRSRWRSASIQAERDGPMKAWRSFLGYFVYSTLPLIVSLALGVTLYMLTPSVVAQRPAELIGADVSTKPANWTGENTEGEIALVKGAQLIGKDLRNASAVEAFLVKANLVGANLREANLVGADLQRANLPGANLQEAGGLTSSQVHAATGWADALYSDDILTELGLPSDHNQMVCSRLLSDPNFSVPTWCDDLLDQR